MRTFKDISYSDYEKCKLDLHIPDCDEFPVIVYFHGGGLEIGDKAGDGMFKAEGFENSGIAIASANYRMYPEARYPDFVEDAAMAVKWVFDNICSYGKCSKIFIGGSSAGAYLAMMLCFDNKYLGKHGIKSCDVAGYIFDGGQPTVHLNVLKERNLDTRSVIIDDAAPIYHIRENPDAPPMLILVAENDIPNRLEQTYLLCSTLKCFGYEGKYTFKLMEGYGHCQYSCALDAEDEKLYVGMIKDFVRSTL